MTSDVNWENFQGEDFTFPGFYRAIIEDNEDPIDVGRVRVRIFGMHSLDPQETPVEHLPWAEPCLPLYYSGGQNLDNQLQGSEGRYTGGGSEPFQPPDKTSDIPTYAFSDETMEEYGTGGILTVPKKGNMVWIFFEGGDHMRPHYFAMATKKPDWERQKQKIVEDIKTKRENAEAWREVFESIVDKNQHTGSVPAQAALLETNTRVEMPKLEFFNVDEETNYNMTSYTSPGGITHVIVNTDGKERHYICHKSELQYMEHTGQSKRIVGNLGFATSQNVNTDPNDFEELIANNYELHIGGDMDVFVRKSKSVQIEGDHQVNVGKNLSLVTREGNVNIIVEKGDANVSVNTGKLNAYAAGDVQVNTESNARINVGQDAFLNVTGNVNAEVSGAISLSSVGSISVNSNSEISFKCTKFSITSPVGFEVNGGTQFSVKPSGFGGNNVFNAPVVRALHPGCFPGPVAGGPSPFPAAPTIPSPPSPLVFSQGSQTELEDPNPPAFEEEDTQETTIPEPSTLEPSDGGGS
jgi:hypothetical protein